MESYKIGTWYNGKGYYLGISSHFIKQFRVYYHRFCDLTEYKEYFNYDKGQT